MIFTFWFQYLLQELCRRIGSCVTQGVPASFPPSPDVIYTRHLVTQGLEIDRPSLQSALPPFLCPSYGTRFQDSIPPPCTMQNYLPPNEKSLEERTLGRNLEIIFISFSFSSRL